MENLKLEPNDREDEVTASVYGSRFAAECLPMHEMPEKEMPKEIAYRMIRDDLSLDGNPMLNLASFVTTYMVCLYDQVHLHSVLIRKCDTQEEEVEKLMAEALPKNFIDYEEYPQTADIQNRCVSMIARMFNAPTHDENENAMGTSTVGSSEAIVRISESIRPIAMIDFVTDAGNACHEETLAKQA